jgi:hypothetical protein
MQETDLQDSKTGLVITARALLSRRISTHYLPFNMKSEQDPALSPIQDEDLNKTTQLRRHVLAKVNPSFFLQPSLHETDFP